MNIPQADSAGISLTKGEILKGVVESVKENGTVQVNINGQVMEARTEGVELVPGQQLMLLVDDQREGSVYLKVITPQMLESFQNEKLSGSLQMLGIKADDETLLLAQKLIQHNLPVTKENLTALTKMARQLGGSNSQNLELSALALQVGAKTDPELVTALRSFLTQPVPVKQALQEAIRFLTQAQNQTAGTPVNTGTAAVAQPAAPVQGSAPSISVVQPQPQRAASAIPAPISAAAAPVSEGIPMAQPLPHGNQPTALIMGPSKGSPGTESQPSAPAPGMTAPQAQNATGAIAGKVSAGIPNLPGAAAPAAEPLIPGNQLSQTRNAAMPETVTTAATTAALRPPQADPRTPQSVPVFVDAAPETKTEPTARSQGQPPTDRILPEAGRIAQPTGGSAAQTTVVSVFDKADSLPAKARELLQLLLPMVQVREQDAEPVDHQLRKHFAGQKEVLAALDIIDEAVRKDRDLSQHQPVQQALTRLDQAEKELVGQAVFNSLDRPSTDTQPAYYYFAFPVEANGRDNHVELKIFKDEKNKRPLEEMNQIRIAVGLDTQNYGQVVFHVTWRRGEGLTLQGAVQSIRARQSFESQIDVLTGRLRELGFAVVFQGFKVAPEREELRPRLEKSEDNRRILGVDIKV